MAHSHSIRRAAVFGATGGIGGALVQRLLSYTACERVFAGGRKLPVAADDRVIPFAFDLLDEASIANAAQAIASDGTPDLIIVTTGILHHGDGAGPEKSYRAITADEMAHLFAINSIGPALIAKHMLPLMPRGQRSVLAMVSARVGSISDNRLGGWHSYRASKAALNMLLRNFAIEMAPRAPEAVIVGLHPGTVDSALSRPFQRGVPEGKLFTPEQSASCLLDVIDGLTTADSGGVFAWDGARIPA